MSEVTVSHIIGTVCLVALFFTVGSYYTMSYMDLRYEVMKTQLTKISEYSASNIIDMVSLCYMSEDDQLLIKRLDIPVSLASYGYDVVIESTGEDILRIEAYLLDPSNVYGESVLPWSAGGKICGYNQTDAEVNDYIEAHYPSLDPDVLIYSGQSNTVAWCLKLSDKITIGLGTLSW